MKRLSRIRIFIVTCIFIFSSALYPLAATVQESSAAQEETIPIPFDSTTKDIAGWPTAPILESNAAVVIEAETGTVLYDKNMNMRCYPASITKILTAILAIENSSLHDMVYYSEGNIASVPRDSSHIAINPGEELTMENSLYGMLLASANECANAIAEHVSGSVPAFVEKMNERAKELGAVNTHFANANGLPDDNHYTTCYDMAMISRAAVFNETYRKINGITSYLIPPTNLQPEFRPINSLHRLLMSGSSHYEGCFGGKTGYTTAAGSTLVTFAERDGMTLICVVMQSTSPACFTDSAALLDYGFQSFKRVNIAENETNYTFHNDAFFPSSSSIFEKPAMEIELNKTSVLILPIHAEFSDAKAELTFADSSSDEEQEESEEGYSEQTGRTTLATITYFYGGHYVGSTTLNVTYGDVDTFSFTKSTPVETTSILETTSTEKEPISQERADIISTAPKHVIKINVRYFIAGITVIVILLLFYFYLSKTKVERERRKRIRRQQKRQFGTYSRLNMLYPLKRRGRKNPFKNRRRRLRF